MNVFFIYNQYIENYGPVNPDAASVMADFFSVENITNYDLKMHYDHFEELIVDWNVDLMVKFSYVTKNITKWWNKGSSYLVPNIVVDKVQKLEIMTNLLDI